MENLERQKSFVLQGVKFTVKFPNVGQMIDMESLKQALTGNKYGAMSASGVKSMFYALDVVDTISFFEILCPRVKASLGTKNLAELSSDEIQPLIDVYKEQIAPWYNKVLSELYNITDNGDKSETASTEE